MKKTFTLCIAALLVFVLLTAFDSFAEERITLTTYFPAPYGVYREMRIDKLAVGSPYRDSSLPDDGNLIVSGDVGIGTTNPLAKLEVIGGNTHIDGSVGIGTTSPLGRLEVTGGDTYIADYLRMKDFDEEGGTNQIISRDGFLQFPDGPVAIGTYSNGDNEINTLSPAPIVGDLVLQGGIYLAGKRRSTWADFIYQSIKFTRPFTSTGGCETVTETKVITGCIKHERAAVNMMGYRFNYTSGDAHLDNITVRLSNPTITYSTGGVSFSISICYYENGQNEDYTASVDYTVLCW
ncbi:hypothetical protein ACFL2J_03035 [Candidatus Omnitrophota bacterium]